MTVCPECGAEATPEISCQSVFDECLIKEFTDPDFGAVHHLTVAAYMLQHSSKLSREGWLSMRELLREFLVENKSPVQIRRQNKAMVDSGNRTWKITSRDGLPKITRVNWTRTILDVHLDTSAVYCADVTAWARTALDDSQSIA
jgi:hypothetical protein